MKNQASSRKNPILGSYISVPEKTSRVDGSRIDPSPPAGQKSKARRARLRWKQLSLYDSEAIESTNLS